MSIQLFSYAIILAQLLMSGFLFVVFLSLRGNKKANKLMAGFLLLFAFFSAFDIVQIVGIKSGLYYFYVLSSIAMLCVFPLFYFYVMALYNMNLNRRGIHFFLPFIGIFLLVIGHLSDKTMPAYYNNFSILSDEKNDLTTWFYFVVNDVFFVIQVFVYSWLILKVIKKVRPSLEENYSNLEGKKLNWVRNLLIALASIFVFYLIVESLVDLSQIMYDFLYYCFSLFFLLIVSFGAIRQSEVGIILDTVNSNDIEKTKEKSSLQLSEYETQTLKTRLIELAEQEKFFTKRDLTLPELASMLDTNKNVMSNFLNKSLKLNFYAYINSLRIEEAKRLLAENMDGKYSMEGIGYMAGFNSKTTFNTVFKTTTGMSPSEYKNKIAS